jgi:hypothetical protein
MAQKVQVMLLCDLDDGSVDAEETLQFGLGNIAYEVDVCAKHAQQFRDNLEPFIAHGRKISSARSGQRQSRTTGARQETADIRAWAKDQGIHINGRGRIPASVVKEYKAAH